MNALLVYPRFPVTYWGFQYSMRLIGKRTALPPLGLLTLAALLPADWHLRLVDLNAYPLSDEDLRWADVVLTGGQLIQTRSLQEVIARSTAAGIPVAVGGPAPTASPELFGLADVVFQGEAEGRVDELVGALARAPGGHQILPAPATFPEMTRFPVPRFDLLDLSQYASVSVQFSRGCPFHCEFCDVIEIFGGVARVKTPEQVVAELEAIYRQGYSGTLFFVDDNFIGNKAAVRRLLPILRDWQRERGRPFELYTEASVNLAADPQLLSDMVAAGFSSVFVGIETPSRAALAQTKKLQNLQTDLAQAVSTMTRAGLEVMGGFIVGFDTDDAQVLAQQREFLAHQPIPVAMVGLLMALPGTALWHRLEREGRLRARASGDQFSRPNFVPAMEEGALLQGYVELMRWLYSPRVYYSRCAAYLDGAGAIAEGRRSNLGEVGVLLRTMWRVGVLSGRRLLFWRLMYKALRRGRSHLRQAVAHAVQGEHFIRYTRDHLVPHMERVLAQLGPRPQLAGSVQG